MSIYHEVSVSKFKPTYLYIKQHSITGKLYFGKTIKHDIEKYKGSGTHWIRHIKKYGREHVINLWYCLFNNQEDCTNFAEIFSEQQNIVESSDWLNLIIENGIDGGDTFSSKSNESKLITRIKISNSKIGKHRSNETKHKISITNTGKITSDITKIKMRINHVGNTGNTHSDTTKLKMRLAKIGKIGIKLSSIICPHCNKTGAINGMKRWHFDNCKFKINSKPS